MAMDEERLENPAVVAPHGERPAGGGAAEIPVHGAHGCREDGVASVSNRPSDGRGAATAGTNSGSLMVVDRALRDPDAAC